MRTLQLSALKRLRRVPPVTKSRARFAVCPHLGFRVRRSRIAAFFADGALSAPPS